MLDTEEESHVYFFSFAMILKMNIIIPYEYMMCIQSS